MAARIGNYLHAVSDSSAFADVVTPIAVLLRSISDAETFADVVTQIKSKARTATDVTTGAESTIRAFTRSAQCQRRHARC